MFNFLNFSNPSEPAAWDRSTQEFSSNQNAEHATNQNSACMANQNSASAESDESKSKENVVEKALNKGAKMKSIFSHLMETENEVQKSTKPVSFQVKTVQANKKKEFKSIFSHLEQEEPVAKKNINLDAVAIETETNTDRKGVSLENAKTPEKKVIESFF